MKSHTKKESKYLNNASEIWKPIKGFETAYEISNKGRVKSLSRFTTVKNHQRLVKSRMIKLNPSDHGYLMFGIRINKFRKAGYVHRIVAETFVPNPKNLPEVNHKDGNKQNNNSENLEWCTHKDNVHHGIRTGLTVNYGENSKNHVLTEKEVIKFRRICRKGETISSISELFNKNNKTIRCAISGDSWKYLNSIEPPVNVKEVKYGN